MSEKFIPTTSEVREKYAEEPDEYQEYSSYQSHTDEDELAEFDRWLAEHDARVRREALELSDEELDDICRLMLNKSSERACRSCLRGALAAIAERRGASDVRA